MNEARRQAARPGDFGGGPKGSRKLPAEVKAMARQMGLSAKDLNAMGDDLWGKLTDLSSEDPQAYQDLMKESAKHIAKNAGEELAEEPDDERANELMNKILGNNVLTPVPGFVVKCQLKYGGGKVMVNVCSHQAVVPPSDQRGKDCTTYKPGISPQGLQIPLVVGQVRACTVAGGSGVAEGKAVDVLVHTWVMDRITNEGPRGGPWRAEISALAVSWVARETKLPLDANWKHIQSKYKGGLGTKCDGPVPFDIDEAQYQSKPPEDRKKKVKKEKEAPIGVSASPAELLKRSRDIHSKAEEETMKIKLPTAKKPSKPLVQEVVNGEVIEASADGFDISDDIDKIVRKPAVKKGFLRTAKARKAALYPEGSTQGDSQKEGTYSRFMSKCKVVDTTTMSPQEQEAAMRQHAGAPPVPPLPPKPKPMPAPPEPSRAFNGAKKGFLNNAKSLYDDDEATQRKTTDDFAFDAAMAELDPEFSSAHKNEDESPFGIGDEDDTIAQLRSFAQNVDWSSGSMDFKKPPNYNPAQDYAKHDHSQRAKPRVETEAKPAPGSRAQDAGELQRGMFERDTARQKAKVAARAAAPAPDAFACAVDRTADGRVRVLANLAGISSFGDVDLDVAASTLRVRERGGRRRAVRVELPYAVDAASASAKFSKKRGQLKVTLSASAAAD